MEVRLGETPLLNEPTFEDVTKFFRSLFEISDEITPLVVSLSGKIVVPTSIVEDEVECFLFELLDFLTTTGANVLVELLWVIVELF